MKLREYFGELKTPVQIAAEYLAVAYFNEEIVEVEKEDILNYVKQCNINQYELIFHAANEIGAKTLMNFADIARDYPILNVNWLKTNIDNAKIESDLRILLNVAMPGEIELVEDSDIEESPQPKQGIITQDFDKRFRRPKL